MAANRALALVPATMTSHAEPDQVCGKPLAADPSGHRQSRSRWTDILANTVA